MFNFSRPSTPVQPEMGLFLEIDVNIQNGSTDRDAVCDIKKNGADDFFVNLVKFTFMRILKVKPNAFSALTPLVERQEQPVKIE